MPTLRPTVLRLCSALALLFAGHAAQAQYAAQTSVGTAWPCPSFCGGSSNSRFLGESHGGDGFTSSATDFSNQDGNGRALVSLTGPTSLPVLKAEAYSPLNGLSRVSAFATAMQGFTLGPNALGQYDLDISLSGDATGQVSAQVWLFVDTDPSTPPPFSTSAGTLFFEIFPGSADLQVVDSLNLGLPANGSTQTVGGTLSAIETPAGSNLYVWAQLNAVGRDGTYANAYHTLDFQWADATGLTPTSAAAVPEPGTLLSMLAGLGLLAAGRRRRL